MTRQSEEEESVRCRLRSRRRALEKVPLLQEVRNLRQVLGTSWHLREVRLGAAETVDESRPRRVVKSHRILLHSGMRVVVVAGAV